MASVFKKKNKNGKPEKIWRFKYKDLSGRWICGTGWPEKQKSLEHALSLEAEHRAVRKGEKAPPSFWSKNRNKPIDEVIADYLAWGRAQGGRFGRPWDEQNACLKKTGLDWWVQELDLTVLSQINLSNVEQALQRLREAGKAPKTVALRVEPLRCLCCWAVKRGLLHENPIRGMAKLDARPVQPHRPLSDSEVAGLLKAAPAHRRVWYQTGLQSGFRLNELRCIRVKDLNMFGPSIFLAADFSKDRKDHTQYITKELAEELSKLVEKKSPEDRLLGIPFGPNPAEYIAKDYTAGEVTIVTPEGKATWHSLRKVFVNNVVRSGADLKTVMETARHSSATMSLDIYAGVKPNLLRAAANGVKKAVSDSASGAGVENQKSENSAADVSSGQHACKGRILMVGDTGLEPKKHPYTSWNGKGKSRSVTEFSYGAREQSGSFDKEVGMYWSA
jgi:integrase